MFEFLRKKSETPKQQPEKDYETYEKVMVPGKAGLARAPHHDIKHDDGTVEEAYYLPSMKIVRFPAAKPGTQNMVVKTYRKKK